MNKLAGRGYICGYLSEAAENMAMRRNYIRKVREKAYGKNISTSMADRIEPV